MSEKNIDPCLHHETYADFVDCSCNYASSLECWDYQQNKINQLKTKLDKAIKALEFYASAAAYEQIKDVHADWRYALIEEDEYYTKNKEHFIVCKAGKFAIETLKEIRGEK